MAKKASSKSAAGDNPANAPRFGTAEWQAKYGKKRKAGKKLGKAAVRHKTAKK